MPKNSYFVMCVLNLTFSNIIFFIVCFILIILYVCLLKSISFFFFFKYFKNIVAVGLSYYLILFYKPDAKGGHFDITQRMLWEHYFFSCNCLSSFMMTIKCVAPNVDLFFYLCGDVCISLSM
jgi:hypothetical protein